MQQEDFAGSVFVGQQIGMIAEVTRGLRDIIFMAVVQTGLSQWWPAAAAEGSLRDQRSMLSFKLIKVQILLRVSQTWVFFSVRTVSTKGTVVNHLLQLLIQKVFTVWGFYSVFLGKGMDWAINSPDFSFYSRSCVKRKCGMICLKTLWQSFMLPLAQDRTAEVQISDHGALEYRTCGCV